MADLSVLIPARREQWLSRTVEDVLLNAQADTEVIVVLDGEWPEKGYELKQHPKVTVLKEPASIGQRAATNLAARVSTARYLLKLDGHCSVAPGFDTELIRTGDELGPTVTQIPAQKNLHIYDRVCPCGRREYQGSPKVPCVSCGKTEWTLDIKWQPKRGVHTTSWTFDNDLKFQYDKPGQRAQTGDICDVMTSLGACIFVNREHFLELGGFDESYGSWGQFGQEWACKEWLSGGRHVVNRRTWFAHFFRVGGVGFPYEIHGSDQDYARQYARNLWRGNHWPGQAKPLRWLVDKFWPVPGWTEEQRDALPRHLDRAGADTTNSGHSRGLRGAVEQARPTAAPGVLPAHGCTGGPSKGLVYYTDNRGDEAILSTVRSQIQKACNGYPVVAVTQSDDQRFHDAPHPQWGHVTVFQQRGILTMFRQILAGLTALDTEFAFLVEHDVIYAPEHFQFTPPRHDVYYYNTNVWHVDAATGRAVTYLAKRTSQLCANRELLVSHYRKRVAIVERHGFTRAMGFEPGSHGRKERVDDVPSDTWHSARPNIDIKHGKNLTPARWSPAQFRDQRNCQGWQESDSIPGWGKTFGRFDAFLQEVRGA